MEKIYELCPHCENEVELDNDFVVQECPECKHPILPCSICEHTNEHGCHTKCDTCPLNEQLLIDNVLYHIKRDCESGDVTAIEELIRFCPKKNLIAFLPEEEWVNFK
jgi:predicted RNA-binding Zn-ribbon protein involved in translation (DUF1610 family)